MVITSASEDDDIQCRLFCSVMWCVHVFAISVMWCVHVFPISVMWCVHLFPISVMWCVHVFPIIWSFYPFPHSNYHHVSPYFRYLHSH